MDNASGGSPRPEDQTDKPAYEPYSGAPAYSSQPPSTYTQIGNNPVAPVQSAEGQHVPPPPYVAYPQTPPPGYVATTPTSTFFASRRNVVAVSIAILAVVLAAGAYMVGGEAANFMNVGLLFAPLAILALLAYGGRTNTVAAVFCYVWLAMVGFAILFYSFANTLLATIKDFALFTAWSRNPNAIPLSDVFKPEAFSLMLWSAALLAFVAILSLLVLFRPVRVALSRIMPIDPDNFVHKIALCTLTLILFSSFVPLIVLGGRPPLLEFIKAGGLQSLSQPPGDVGISLSGTEEMTGIRPQDLIYQLVWTIPATLIAAGWPIARRFRPTLERLGMVVPSAVQVVAAIGIGLVLFAFAAFLLEPGIIQLWKGLGWSTTDVAAFEQLLSNLITPLGAVVIGVTAGIGEEMAVRGLLQPRIGIIASNLVFTSLHAFQYGFDALLSVFVVGLVLGIVRARSNTTTSAIVHAIYNFTTVMASVLAGGQSP